jgi:hypothetical protein
MTGRFLSIRLKRSLVLRVTRYKNREREKEKEMRTEKEIEETARD